MGLANLKTRPQDRLTAIVAVVLVIDGMVLAAVSVHFLFHLVQYNLTASFSFTISWFAIAAAGMGLWFPESHKFWELEIGFSSILSLLGLVVCLIDWIFVGVEHLSLFVPLFVVPIITGTVYWVLYSRALSEMSKVDLAAP